MSNTATGTVAWLDPGEVMCTAEVGMEELWEEMVIQAAWWLDALTGGVLHGPQAWQEDYDTSFCPCRIDLRRGPVEYIDGYDGRTTAATSVRRSRGARAVLLGLICAASAGVAPGLSTRQG